METTSDISLIRIESYYNLEKIFSYLEERNKLDIIIYNKQLQKNQELISMIMEI